MPPQTLYSADDVAALLGLHVRTVRNYVRDGRLPAIRIGKQYRIPKDAVDELIGNDPQSAAVRRVEVMAILAIVNVDAPTLSRLSTLVTGALGNRSAGDSQLHVETVYDEQRRSVKIIVIGGGAADTANVVSLVGGFAESEL
ncbi:MAG TPA: helix-turn-helix domain-containing protein [Aldersonia sp.]